jgi:hypothetical protein
MCLPFNTTNPAYVGCFFFFQNRWDVSLKGFIESKVLDAVFRDAASVMSSQK